MPDRKQIVRKKFRVLRVCSPELTEELADHLEDMYEAFLQEGKLPEAAFRRTVAHINRRSQIRLTLWVLKEVLMRNFARKVGLPGLLTFALSMGIEIALEMAHAQPKTILLGNGLPFSLPPIAWLCLLPICGATGALLSHRSGGSRFQRIAAGLFPSAIMAAVLLIIFVAGFAISLFVPNSGWNWALAVPALALWLMGQAILTAVPLLLGTVAEQQMKRVRLLT